MKSERYLYSLLSGVIRVAVLAMILVVSQATVAHAIINGQPDASNYYPYVGLVTDGEFVCSGAAISERVFITAAHCFATPGSQVQVTFEQQGFYASMPNWAYGTWYPDPNFRLLCGQGSGLPEFITHDVAVVIFDEPVSLSRYARLPTVDLVNEQAMRADVRIIGYGAQDQLRQLDYETEIFTRHFAPTQLIRSNHSFSGEFLKLTANPSHGQGGLCFGDSGGPDILGDTDIILAVNSFVTNSNCTGVTYSNRVDTDDALEFIESTVSMVQ